MNGELNEHQLIFSLNEVYHKMKEPHGNEQNVIH